MKNPDSLHEYLRKKIDVSRETSTKLYLFTEILLKRNQELNLIGKNTSKEIHQRHILDSLQLLNYINSNDQILDIGTGAGFPGLVLNIAGCKNLTLVESIRKKCTFLQEVKSYLELSCTIINNRSEDIPPIASNIITARAVSPLKNSFSLAFYHQQKNTFCLFFKGKIIRKKLWKLKNCGNLIINHIIV